MASASAPLQLLLTVTVRPNEVNEVVTALLNMVLFHRVLAVNGKTVDTTAVDMNVANVTYPKLTADEFDTEVSKAASETAKIAEHVERKEIKLQMVKVTVGYLTNSVEVWEEWKLQIKVDSNVVATETEDRRLAHRAALTEMLDNAATKIADYVASPNVRPIPRIVKSGPGPSPLPFRIVYQEEKGILQSIVAAIPRPPGI